MRPRARASPRPGRARAPRRGGRGARRPGSFQARRRQAGQSPRRRGRRRRASGKHRGDPAIPALARPGARAELRGPSAGRGQAIPTIVTAVSSHIQSTAAPTTYTVNAAEERRGGRPPRPASRAQAGDARPAAPAPSAPARSSEADDSELAEGLEEERVGVLDEVAKRGVPGPPGRERPGAAALERGALELVERRRPELPAPAAASAQQVVADGVSLDARAGPSAAAG